MSAHTPTPWIEQEMPGLCNDRITADNGEGRTICELPYGHDADSAFIVRAVNAHDDLLAVLRDLRQRFHAACVYSGSDAWVADSACTKADAALAKAGAP